MSVNNFFGNKKRNSSILYDVDQTKITSPLQRSISHNNIGNHGEGFPPNKRYKSVVSSKCKETEDPFGDNDDFTVDDLKEIDVISSQALTLDVSSETNLLKTEQNAQLSVFPNSINQFKTPDQWNITLTTEAKPFGKYTINTEISKRQWIDMNQIYRKKLQQIYFYLLEI